MKYIYIIITVVVFSIGLSAQCIDDTHSPFQNQGWMSCNTSVGPIPERGDVHWLQYDLGDIYVLDSIYIWNHNVWGETEMGVKSFMVDYSIDEQNWVSAGPFIIDKAPGSWKYQGTMGPALNNALAQYVVVSVLSTYSEDVACAGVGEFLFYLGEMVDVKDQELADTEWSISPNPSSEFISIRLPIETEILSLAMYNSIGQKISDLEIPANRELQFPIRDLQNGLYYINYQSEKDTRSKSFVKVD